MTGWREVPFKTGFDSAVINEPNTIGLVEFSLLLAMLATKIVKENFFINCKMINLFQVSLSDKLRDPPSFSIWVTKVKLKHCKITGPATELLYRRLNRSNIVICQSVSMLFK